MSEFTLESQADRAEESTAPEPYLVLARKYRPTTFDDLIGQDAMVQTLANAIRQDRIAHAFLMTGVRGVGKTSTARLIAKALNCVGPDGKGGPTITPCGVCEPCRAITEGRFIDVVEMDAASHTGVDDMRHDVIEASRYAAVSARYKIYIIDEVHMLSKNAFNALLKTLEEPPPHVKFIMATTEVGKVPVTVLSRTQRFDLKRIPADRLAQHFGEIATKEGVSIDPEALKLIAQAAEGSVRDGLSLLDQAIAHNGEADGSGVSAEAVRQMLGLSDRSRIRGLLKAILEGDSKAALAELAGQYELGVAPDMALEGLLEIVHAVTRMQVGAEDDVVLSAEGRQQLAEWADTLAPATLHRFWQLALKGLEETKRGVMPLQTAEMAVLRLVHAAQMPDPGALIRALDSRSSEDAPALDNSGREPVQPSASAPMNSAPSNVASISPPPTARQPAPRNERPSFAGLPESFEQLLDHLADAEPVVEAWLHDQVACVHYSEEEMVLAGDPDHDKVGKLQEELRKSFGRSVRVSFDEKAGGETILQRKEAAAEAARQAVLSDPASRRVLEIFPGAELVDFDLGEAQSAAAKQRNG